MKDGWHVICGFDVYIENDRIVRGTLGAGTSYRAAYPYKQYKNMRGWHNVSGTISANAFRYGVNRGNVTLF